MSNAKEGQLLEEMSTWTPCSAHTQLKMAQICMVYNLVSLQNIKIYFIVFFIDSKFQSPKLNIFLVQPQEGIVGIIIGTVSTCLIMILVIFFVYRRRQDSNSADDEDRLTAEEEALIAKKLGSMSHSQYGQGGHVPKVNNVPSVYAGSSNKKLNNQNYHQPANRRNDIMIRNHITPPNVKIHNNLRSKRDGTEI